MSRPISRRKFIGQASCAALGSSALFSTLFNLRMSSVLSAQSLEPVEGEDYRALVCLFLAGGNDSFNMLVPHGQAEYQEYSIIRSDLALPNNQLLPLNGTVADGRAFAVHPGMTGVQQLYNDRRLAFVSNVGTLVEPTTLAQLESGRVKLPLGLFSHSDQIMQWQTSVPDQRSTTGWAGRMADLLHEANDDNTISMNISLSGNNVFQSGDTTVSFTVHHNRGVEGLDGYSDKPWLLESLRTSAINSMMDQHYKNIYAETYASILRNSIDAGKIFTDSLGQSTPVNSTFSDNNVSQSFRMIADIIAARGVLNKRRQTFFILFGGWDHHDEVLDNQAQMLPIVSHALSEFSQALDELGLTDKVTTFTSSDFSRTLTSNGRGSDHAWGANHMVMGGAVNGGQIYGQYPSLYSGGPQDYGRGRLIPTLSVDEYFAELALWFGVPRSGLTHLFPNLDRFYDPYSLNSPIGFLS